MLVKYKQNKKPACYDTDSLVSVGRIRPDPRPSGPFASCGDCPYAAHGFLCYSSEGDCMRTALRKFQKRKAEKA